MIVTKSWLNEFIDLSQVSNETLYETFNAIGLEVDSMNEIAIPDKVVVGKILSCEKHPNADKLNVCQIDIGTATRQIVCGAANVVDAEYVAVATIGAVLPGDFVIKHAELRGVESEGMVCASSELGLPDTGKGIMILDESIGVLEVGRNINTYPCVNDTIIELELTANRGDCLSIYGVARDLSAALDIEMKTYEYKKNEKKQKGIARIAEIRTQGTMDGDLHYKLANINMLDQNCLIKLRLAMIDIENKDLLATYLGYVTHATGVVLRAYDAKAFSKNDKFTIDIFAEYTGIMAIQTETKVVSYLGINQDKETIADENTKLVFIEASYINPDTLVEAVSKTGLKKDDLYYKTSRGSNPDLNFGLTMFFMMLDENSDINYYDGILKVKADREQKKVIVDIEEISSIIGMSIERNTIVKILKKLAFEITVLDEKMIAVNIPLFRQDIVNIQDITEEIVRIVGINNIDAKPFVFAEESRINSTTARYKVRKSFKNRAVGTGFYENVSYVFSDKKLLDKYGFVITDEALALVNPIAEELNTLRSTILVNLLLATKRNVSYSKKSIPLFEIGQRFDSKRNQSEVITFLFSGQLENDSIRNAGKPSMIDFATFTQKLSTVIGVYELEPCTYENGLLHPYQSANIIVDGKVCGFISKLHPTVQDDFDLPVTFVAEIDFDALIPTHINAKPISKFQGVSKDLSIVIDKSMQYYEVAKVIHALDLVMLKDTYPVDIYVDEDLGDKKSLTIRFFIQSMDKTLEDSDIETVMTEIMTTLETKCKATLR